MSDWVKQVRAIVAGGTLVLSAASEQASLAKLDPVGAGVTVNAAGTDRATPCAGVQDFLFVPGSSLSAMALGFTCPDDRKRRLCKPAEASPPSDPGTPALAFYLSAQLVSLQCNPATFSVETSRLVTTIDGVPEACEQVSTMETTGPGPASECVAGADPLLSATCLKWTCEGSAVEKSCFPIGIPTSQPMPIGSGATETVTAVCESAPPLLNSNFDAD